VEWATDGAAAGNPVPELDELLILDAEIRAWAATYQPATAPA
jgi:hypothetical protein